MRRTLADLGGGILAGFGWGVSARLWMRFISDEPEFTWSGTIFILGAATIAGLGMGIARRWPRTLTQVTGTVMLLPLGMGAGIMMLPTILAGATGWTRRTQRATGILCAVIGLVPATFVIMGLFGELGVVRAVAGTLGYGALCALMISIASVSLQPSALPSRN